MISTDIVHENGYFFLQNQIQELEMKLTGLKPEKLYNHHAVNNLWTSLPQYGTDAKIQETT